MKKLLFNILITCLLVVSMCGYAAEDSDIYEQSFDDYTGGRFEDLNETVGGGSWTLLPWSQYFGKGTDGDNTYMYFVNENDEAPMSMTYTFTEPIDEGTVVFSYEIAHSGEVSSVPRTRLFDENNKERLIFFINAHSSVQKVSSANIGFASNVAFGSKDAKYKDITPNVPVKVTQVLNFDDEYFETYVEGELLGRLDEIPFEKVTAWGIYSYNTMCYFDNLSIKTLGDLNYSVDVTGDMGGTNLKITVPDGVTDEALMALEPKNIVVTDRYEERVLVKRVSVSGKTIIAEFNKALEYDERYSLKLDGLKDMYGRNFSDTTFMSKSEVDENGNTVLRVKNVTAVTLDGEELEFIEGMTPEIAQIKVEFNTFVSEIENGFELNGKVLSGSVTDKTVVLETEGVLVGNTEYNFAVNQNVKSNDNTAAKDYSLSFKTLDGGLNIKECNWFTEADEPASLSDIVEGKKLKLVLKVANTTSKVENLYLTYSALKGNLQKTVMLMPVAVKSGEYGTFELDYTVGESGEEIRGIVLDNFTSLTPLTEFAAIR